MKNILVLFGGETTEHDISILTAIQVCDSFDVLKYNVVPVYINKNGEWFLVSDVGSVARFLKSEFNIKNRCVLNYDGVLSVGKGLRSKKITIDYAFICMHGINGEDGTMAGLLDLYHIPTVNCGVESSSIAMNKILFKKFMLAIGVPVIDYFDVCSVDEVITRLNKKTKDGRFLFPLIVKPARLGSSIGVVVCNNIDEYEKACVDGLMLDDSLLVERCLTNFNEYNIAIYNTEDGFVVSDIEQPLSSSKFLSFEEKYLNDGKGDGMENISRVFPAKISKNLQSEIAMYAKKIYHELNMKGVVRFDFIYDNQDKKLYINEANTIPGSYANYLFRNKQISFTHMLDDLIAYARVDYINKKNIVKTFDTSVLKEYSYSIKK